jgi:hypothetical protein
MTKDIEMTRPDTPYEAASYDLNKFRERRLADRRFNPRASEDRRGQASGGDPDNERINKDADPRPN